MWFYQSALRASYHSVADLIRFTYSQTYCLASQGPEVMIGNSVLEPEATHNQTLPIVTMVTFARPARPLVFLVLWCRPLPMLTILYHGSDLGLFLVRIAFTSRRLRPDTREMMGTYVII